MSTTGNKFVCVRDFEDRSRPLLSKVASAYYYSGADEETTLRENVAAFQRIKLRPRVLRKIGKRQMSTTVLGRRVDIPIGISPFGFGGLAWPDGEICLAKGAQKKGACFVLSTAANARIEDVVNCSPTGLKWFQLYILKDRALTETLVRKAEQLGFKALVVTVDAPSIGHRRASMRTPLVLPPHLKLPLLKGESERGIPIAATVDLSISWKDIHWLKSICKLPIIVKGVMTGEDADIAVREGVAAVWVSNHGGRQLDTSLSTIEVLPEVVSAVKGRVEVYIDGGVRLGTDVLKALALGARAVFIGGPAIWGLACQGQEGVESVLDILEQELSIAMALTGCSSLNDINSGVIAMRGNDNSSRL